MLGGAGAAQAAAGQMTNKAPQAQTASPGASAPLAEPAPDLPNAPGLEDDPDLSRFPVAHIVKAGAEKAAGARPATEPVIESDTQSYAGNVLSLDGRVVITYGDRRVEADHIVYDRKSGDVTATGHLVVTGGANQERMTASHGELNLETQTGRFYDVSGSVGVKTKPGNPRILYTTGNPFLFTGRLVVKYGPQDYDIYDGSVTSCQLEHPDWLLTAEHFSVTSERATATRSVFHLLHVPLLFLPYVTHPVDPEARQSGFLIPVYGAPNSTRGTTIGEEFYLVLNRSTDVTLGAEYYSLRGFAPNASLRYRGRGLDFATVRFTSLLDRRTGTGNQGGEDVAVAARYDFDEKTRVATNAEYLSSYVYREAFSNNFNQAITSDIVSTAYAVHQSRGYEFAGLFDRYQGIKPTAQGLNLQQQVRIFHAPSLNLSSTEHRLGLGNLQLSLEASAAGLKRSQPNFVTGGIVERLDLHPELAYPLSIDGWRVRPSIAARETLYSRSRTPQALGQPNTELHASLNRADLELGLDLRAPVVARTFRPDHFTSLLGKELRHTIAPELNYRLVTGVSNFANILRFDASDVVADTNELEYGVTQRLYRRSANARPCETSAEARPDVGGLNPEASSALAEDLQIQEIVTPSPGSGCGDEELISWRLAEKTFFNSTFGGAVVNGRRNIFTTTLDLSGVAFLTEPRQASPIVSRLRIKPSTKIDLEWDFDLDAGAKKFTSSNLFLDVHEGNTFAAVGYARLDAPGRFYTESVDDPTKGVLTPNSDFNQLRLLLGYGSPVKPGLSVAANFGLDLKSFYGTTSTSNAAGGTRVSSTIFPALFQYTAVQASYNWNCCGIAFEYRKFELGSVTNEPGYKFNFTLANIGTAGNLRRAERLF